jgi:hypothetical protein
MKRVDPSNLNDSRGKLVRNALKSLLALALLAAALAIPSTAQAWEYGQVCNTLDLTPVYNLFNYGNLEGWMYTIPPGGGFRIVNNPAFAWFYGHGNERQDGYIREEHLNFSSCHW